MTTSWAQIEAELTPLLERCWATLGIPVVADPLDEEASGLIDPESAILITLLFGKDSRLWTDVPAWIHRHVDLINFQKLSTLLRTIPDKLRSNLNTRLEGSLFQQAPNRFRKLLKLGESRRDEVAMEMRLRKLSPASEVAKLSLVIRNRLLFGTGFRADLVSLLMAEHALAQGTRIAHLLSAANSTVSRILKDLSACEFIDAHGRIRNRWSQSTGLLLSTDSLRNLVRIQQAQDFAFSELREAVLRQADLRHDGFCRMVLQEEKGRGV